MSTQGSGGRVYKNLYSMINVTGNAVLLEEGSANTSFSFRRKDIEEEAIIREEGGRGGREGNVEVLSLKNSALLPLSLQTAATQDKQ